MDYLSQYPYYGPFSEYESWTMSHSAESEGNPSQDSNIEEVSEEVEDNKEEVKGEETKALPQKDINHKKKIEFTYSPIQRRNADKFVMRGLLLNYKFLSKQILDECDTHGIRSEDANAALESLTTLRKREKLKEKEKLENEAAELDRQERMAR